MVPFFRDNSQPCLCDIPDNPTICTVSGRRGIALFRKNSVLPCKTISGINLRVFWYRQTASFYTPKFELSLSEGQALRQAVNLDNNIGPMSISASPDIRPHRLDVSYQRNTSGKPLHPAVTPEAGFRPLQPTDQTE